VNAYEICMNQGIEMNVNVYEIYMNHGIKIM
jgi:hypothetical protein